MKTESETKTIYLEQLLASLLLKFRTLDHLALKIIGDELAKTMVVNYKFQSIDIRKYVEETPYGYKLKDECFGEDEEILFEVREALNNMSDNLVKDYVSRLSINDLVIRKVVTMEILTPADIKNRFSSEENNSIRNLIDTGYLVNIWEDDITNKEYMQVILSTAGKKRAFELMFAEYIKEFKNLVLSSGYDVLLVDEFLLAQDFSKGVYEILNLDNFLKYCESHGKSAIACGVSPIEYKEIEYKKGEGFTSEGQKLFTDMLSVIDDGHCIHICHPNHLFGVKYIVGNSLDLDRLNWNDVDIDKMREMGDFKTFITPDVKDSFRYVHKRLAHQIMKKMELGQDEQSYLVVVEQYNFDNEDSYLVRGIIKGDKKGYSMAFNPEYEKTIPKSVWDRSIRFSGKEVPAIYLVKRPTKPKR